jgi:hypothetical protein
VSGPAVAAPQSLVWSVPSLQSLLERKSSEELRDGFTVFTLRSSRSLDPEADAVSLDLTVNDTPVLIEGLPAALQPRGVDPKQSIVLQFGLQISISTGATLGAIASRAGFSSTKAAKRSARRSFWTCATLRCEMSDRARSRPTREPLHGRPATKSRMHKAKGLIGVSS